ncbi:6963_t:CDS:1, partial [Dentiscutata heterogama]
SKGDSSDSNSRKHGREDDDDDLSMLSSNDADSVVLNNISLESSDDILRKHGCDETMLLNEIDTVSSLFKSFKRQRCY